MREQDVPLLANAWYELLNEYKDRRPEFGEQLLVIIGQYVSTYSRSILFANDLEYRQRAQKSNFDYVSSLYLAWIDISLIANERFMSLIYNILLSNPIRDSAAVCLTDIVKKGMKPLDKLQLIGFLGMVDVLKQVELPVSDHHSLHPRTLFSLTFSFF